MQELAYTLESDKSFGEVVANLEKQIPEHQFRVLAVHNVQETLAEKGLERGPLKIIELCNAKFAHTALQKTPDVALFMPCRYAVYEEGDKTVVKLSRPGLIAQMMPEAGLDDLANGVEDTLKKIMEASV
ncbi:MAG: DUF302 domain-containing protein [bacterium]|nr:DUF302 domain-containing protein [bacterium]